MTNAHKSALRRVVNRPFKLTPEQALALLEAIIQEIPPLEYQKRLTEEDLRWMGRAEAILDATGSTTDLMDFRVARKMLGTFSHSREELLAPLHNAFCRVELDAPAAARGAFIPAGDTWNGYAALVKLIQRECDDLLLVDPYLSSALFIDFVPHSAARRSVRCLTANRSEYHPGLAAAAQKWSSDPVGQSKPVEVRYAPSGALHDRLIILDGAETWLVSQSLKDIAKRSSASVSRAEAELGRLKADHYNAVWNEGTAIA